MTEILPYAKTSIFDTLRRDWVSLFLSQKCVTVLRQYSPTWIRGPLDGTISSAELDARVETNSVSTSRTSDGADQHPLIGRRGHRLLLAQNLFCVSGFLEGPYFQTQFSSMRLGKFGKINVSVFALTTLPGSWCRFLGRPEIRFLRNGKHRGILTVS